MTARPVDPDRLEQEWVQDRDILAALAANGDRAELARMVDVSFRGTPAALEKLEDTADTYGFEVIEVEESDDGDPYLFLAREQTVDEAAIRSLTITCLQIEADFGVEYDGWGCTAQTGMTQ